MDAKINGTLAVRILLASIEVEEMGPVVATIKTLSEENLKWDSVAEILIEEARAIRSSAGTRTEVARVEMPVRVCKHCRQKGHEADRCCLKPANGINLLRELKHVWKKAKKTGSDKNGNRNKEIVAMPAHPEIRVCPTL